jgi:hypothetical protein
LRGVRAADALRLQSDARRAFGFAREKGFFAEAAGDRKQDLQTDGDCPKRWMVISHIER